MSKSDLTVFPYSSESIQASISKSANVSMALELLITSGFQDANSLHKICEFLNDSIESSQIAMAGSVMVNDSEGCNHERH